MASPRAPLTAWTYTTSQTAATQRPCYMCNRMTTTVLATKNSVDFFYTCDGHLADREFASRLGESGDGVQPQGARKLGVSEEEIRKVKEEYEVRQRQRKDEKGKGDEKGKAKENDDGKTAGGASSSSSGNPPSTSASSAIPADGKDKDNLKASASLAPSTAPKPATVHERYALHRAVFIMRLDIHRKKRQSSQAEGVAPRLPSTPRGAMSA